MATITSVNIGNWSDTTVWDSGTVPVNGDTVVSKHNIEFNVDITQPDTLLTSSGAGHYRYSGSGTRTIEAKADAGTHTVSGGMIRMNGSGALIFDGPVKGGSGSSAPGAQNNSSTGTLAVTTATGGSGANAHGAYNGSTGTLAVTTATGGSGSNAHGAYNGSTGTLAVDLAVGNNYGDGVETYATYGVWNNISSNTVTVRKLQFGSHGWPPVYGRTYIEESAGNNSCRLPLVAGGTLTLTDSVGGIIRRVARLIRG